MRWRWVIGVPLVLFGGCGVACGVSAWSIASEQHHTGMQQASTLFRTHTDRFIADAERAARFPIFAPRSGPDARATLSEKIPFLSSPEREPLVFVEEIQRGIDAVPLRRWPADALAIDVSGIDTEWMASLVTYGIWDPYVAPEVVAQRPFALDRVLLPSMQHALRWSKVRLLQGLQGDLPRAGREVEELVRLLFTTEVAVAERVAVRCLGVARATWEYARSHDIDTGDWTPMASEDVTRLERLLSAFPAYVAPHTDQALADVVLVHPATHVGRCSALQDVGALALAVAPVSGSLFEPFVVHTLDLLEHNAKRCRFSALANAWRREKQTEIRVGVDALCNVDEVGPADCVLSAVLLRIPGVRDLGVALAVDVDATSAFRGYAIGR